MHNKGIFILKKGNIKHGSQKQQRPYIDKLEIIMWKLSSPVRCQLAFEDKHKQLKPTKERVRLVSLLLVTNQSEIKPW